MASLRELNQRRVDRMGGKGMYEDQADDLGAGLRQMFGNGKSPRMSEGEIPVQPSKHEAATALSERQSTQPSPPGGVSLPKKPFDVGYDLSPQKGFQREAFGPSIQNQGQTSGDRVAALGYSTRAVKGAPGVTRLDGKGRTIYTDDVANTADWIEGGMRPGISTVSGPSVAELTARAERMRSLREANVAMRDEQNFNAGGALSRQKTQQEIVRDLLTGNSRSGRQVAAEMIDSENRMRAEGLRSAVDMARFAEDSRLNQERLGLDRERFEFDKQPKPMSEIDKVRLEEARYGLSKARADAAAAAADRAGVSPEDRTRLFQNFGGDGGLTDLPPDRMDGAIAQQAISLRANDLANQYSIGGETSSKMFTPTKEDKYTWGDMQFWDDDPNTPNAWQTLVSSVGDVVVGADGRRVNAAGLRKATKDIDLLGKLTKPRN